MNEENYIISVENLCDKAVNLIKYSRQMAAIEIDIIQLMTYFVLGKWIVEEQQNGEKRAQYGKQIIKTLSEKMQMEFETMKSQPLAAKFLDKSPFVLSWSHYLILMRINDDNEREFYEKAAMQETNIRITRFIRMEAFI